MFSSKDLDNYPTKPEYQQRNSDIADDPKGLTLFVDMAGKVATFTENKPGQHILQENIF
jgi:hypothetical protein